MKAKLIIIGLALSIMGYGQEFTKEQAKQIVQMVPITYQDGIPVDWEPEWQRNRLTKELIHQEAKLEMYRTMYAYLEYCYADSVIVWAREKHIRGEEMDSITFYNTYKSFITPYQTSVFGDRYYIDFFKYVDVIKEPHERPTFEGYVIWLGNQLKN